MTAEVAVMNAQAVALAAEQKLGKLILEAPYSSIVDVAASAFPIFPVRLLLRDPFHSDQRIAKVTAPLLVMHGERDFAISIKFGERLYTLAPGPKRFVRFPEGGHENLDDFGKIVITQRSGLPIFLRDLGKLKYSQLERHGILGQDRKNDVVEGIVLMRKYEKSLPVSEAVKEKIAARGAGDPEAMYKIAEAYAMLGDRPAAVRALSASIEGGFFSYPYIVIDPLLEGLHRDDDFQRQLTAARQRHEAFKRRFF
jgi:hypothetical protein